MMRFWLLLFFPVLLCAQTKTNNPATKNTSNLPEVFDAFVVSVTDANWFEAERDGQHVSIKFYGLLAPDRKTNLGLKGSEELGKIIYGRTVRVQRVGFYSSGGIIGLVTLGKRDINGEILRRGLAQTRLYFDHLTEVNARFRELQNQAQIDGLGLWQRVGVSPGIRR